MSDQHCDDSSRIVEYLMACGVFVLGLAGGAVDSHAQQGETTEKPSEEAAETSDESEEADEQSSDSAEAAETSGDSQGAAETSGEQSGESEEEADEPPSIDELSADQKKTYKNHIKRGTKAYDAGNYEKAFTQLKAAHEIHPKPSILFNLGMISEKAGELKRAKKHYQQFTEAPGVSLEDRKRASKRIAGIKEILETTESSEEAKKKAQKQTTDLTVAIEAMETGLETGENSDDDQETDEEKASESTETEEQATSEESATDEQTPDEEGTEDEQTTRADASSESTDESTSGEDETDTGKPERPEISYKWPVYASFGTATAALTGGVVSLMLSKNRIDQGKAAGKAGNDAELQKFEDQASAFATVSSGLFIGGVALAGLGSYFVINQSSQANPSSTSETKQQASRSGVSKPNVSVSVGKTFTGATLSVDF